MGISACGIGFIAFILYLVFDGDSTVLKIASIFEFIFITLSYVTLIGTLVHQTDVPEDFYLSTIVIFAITVGWNVIMNGSMKLDSIDAHPSTNIRRIYTAHCTVLTILIK